MTTKTPPQEPAVEAAIEAACQKCGSQAKSVEYDPIGMVITCSICGKCAYLDRNNQPIEEQQELEETKTGIQESSTPVETAPDAAEIRRGDNLENQEGQPPERGLEPAIDEAPELEQSAINDDEESEPEAVANEVEQPAIDEAEESMPETVTNEAEESTPGAVTNEVEESTPETVTNEVEESEPETVTNEVEESEPGAVTNEVEESEPETATNEVEESGPVAVTSETEESEQETATNEVEESEPETVTNEVEESEPETVTNEVEESEPETVTNEAEEPEQPAISRVVGESEMQNDGCSICGNPPDPEYNNRFQRTALRRCTACLRWEISPAQEIKPGNKNLAIGITMQMNFQGAANNEIKEKVSLLTQNVRISSDSAHYWIRRYAKPALERVKNLQVANSRGEWELDTIILKHGTQVHHCWSITDAKTQYILATGRTSQPRIGEELFKMAMHATGQEPHTILLSADMKKNTPGLSELAGTAALIQRSSSEENPNGSMARLRNAVLKRMESTRGGLSEELMESILGALAMSINLFEQSEQLGNQTPAEAAGVETPYQNWEDIVKKEKETDKPATSRDGSRKTMAKGQNAAEPVETRAEGQDAAEPAETMTEGQDAAGPVETMAEGQDAAEPVEKMAGEKGETITQELGEVLKGLEQRRESLVREYRQVVRDRQAVKRTMEILNREQPAVNSASRETVPVA